MQQFAVSRVTIRRALKELVNESILIPRQGSGYSVQTRQRLTQPLNQISSFSADCHSRGLTPGTIMISRKQGKNCDRESAHFNVPFGSDVMRVRRVRTGDGEPLLVEHATLLTSNAPSWPWPNGSLYLAMEQTNRHPERALQQYTAVLADKRIASQLNVKEGSPLMLVTTACFTIEDAPVEYSQCWFRPDKWSFAHEISRQAT